MMTMGGPVVTSILHTLYKHPTIYWSVFPIVIGTLMYIRSSMFFKLTGPDAISLETEVNVHKNYQMTIKSSNKLFYATIETYQLVKILNMSSTDPDYL